MELKINITIVPADLKHRPRGYNEFYVKELKIFMKFINSQRGKGQVTKICSRKNRSSKYFRT